MRSIDVTTQGEGAPLTFKNYLCYMMTPPEGRDMVLNILSLEFTATRCVSSFLYFQVPAWLYNQFCGRILITVSFFVIGWPIRCRLRW